jgi:hypothetical protein
MDFRRYRDRQIGLAYKDFYTHHRITSADLQALNEKMTGEELSSYQWRIVLYKGLGVLKQILPRSVSDRFRGLTRRQTAQWQASGYKTILDVYDKFEQFHD